VLTLEGILSGQSFLNSARFHLDCGSLNKSPFADSLPSKRAKWILHPLSASWGKVAQKQEEKRKSKEQNSNIKRSIYNAIISIMMNKSTCHIR
jgi:hypothetical protein